MLRIVLALLLSCAVVLILVVPAQGKCAKKKKEDEEYAAALDKVTATLDLVNNMFYSKLKSKNCRKKNIELASALYQNTEMPNNLNNLLPRECKSEKCRKEDKEYKAASDNVTDMLEYIIKFRECNINKCSKEEYDEVQNKMAEKFQHIYKLFSKPNRKECRGYMCAYNHLSGTAAAKIIKKQLRVYLYECAMNPKCSPGKRRRRSIFPNTSLLSKYLLRHTRPS